MPLDKLGHYSVRTARLEDSLRFYVDVLGLKEGYRPPFAFPGAWLYRDGDGSDYGVVHLIGTHPHGGSGLAQYLGDKAPAESGSAAVDHMAFIATDWQAMRKRLEAAEVGFRQRTVPALGLHQVFIEDPSGVTLELNFPASEAP